MSVKRNFEIDQGSTWIKKLSWQDSNRQPFNLLDHTARFVIRKNYADLTKVPPVIVLDDTDGIALSSTSPNIVITLTDEQTASIPHGTYVYDLELEDDEEIVTKLLRGKAFVLAEVANVL